MDNTIDLVDQRQIMVFDALEQLQTLGAASDIKIPRLVVVGDQSSGKSSVLEALARFHFPIREGLCTRFPTKLTFKRSNQELLKVSFDLKNFARSKAERSKLQTFADEMDASKLMDPSGLDDIMNKACNALSLRSWKTPNHPHISETSGAPSVASFAEDILTIEKHGPDLPRLSLVDLPGLFRANSTEQTKVDRDMVERIFEEFVREPANVILVVVTASTAIVNQTVVEKVQTLAREDPGLLNRVIAVITHPDVDADNLEEVKRDLVRESPLLGNMVLLHKFHVVQNQTKAARTARKSLDDRDSKEEDYFNREDWRSIPEGQKGIYSLRATLRKVFWNRTKQEIQNTIIPKIKEKINEKDDYIEKTDKSRSNDNQRRDYLCEIAEKLQRLIREGVDGTYRNERCREQHSLGDPCQKYFFPDPRRGLDTQEGQMHKLCSNIRALNKQFSIVMRRFGRANVICSSDSSKSNSTNVEGTQKSPNQTATDTVAHSFLSSEVITTYYTFDEPSPMSQEEYETMVDKTIERNKGLESDGEVNWIVHREIFRYQAQQWEQIATKHIQAVLKETRKYLDLALRNVCREDTVRQALQDKIIYPSLKNLDEEARKSLDHLLESHREGNPGFFDSFSDVFPVQEQAKDLVQRLNCVSWNTLDEGSGNSAKDLVKDLLIVFCSSMSQLSPTGVVAASSFASAAEILSKHLKQFNNENPNPASILGKNGVPAVEAGRNCNAARVIGKVETIYQTTMIAFVNYVNSIVVEIGILQELEDRILTQSCMRTADQNLINEIAAENEHEVAKREQFKTESQSLKTILKTLEHGLGDKQ